MQGTSSLYFLAQNRITPYPRCINPDKRGWQGRVNIKVIKSQLERKIRPLQITTREYKQTYKLWLEEKTQDTGFSAVTRRLAENPISENTPEGGYDKTFVTFVDTAERPIVTQMMEIKQLALKSKRVHLDFWAPNPYSMRLDIFAEKTTTYVFNDNPLSIHGAPKAKGLKMHMGFVNDARSANGLFDFLCKRILVPEQDLYQV
jgi:hypothetical protein